VEDIVLRVMVQRKMCSSELWHAHHCQVGLGCTQRAEEEFGGLDEEKGGDDNEEAAENGTATTTQGSGLPWDGSDRDYTYEELLGDSQLCKILSFSLRDAEPSAAYALIKH
jgi:hypothetical protein